MPKRKIFFLYLLSAIVCFAQQHSITVRGKIVDVSTREALPNATLRIVGTSKGTVTNTAGEFFLSLSNVPARIAASYVGYSSDTIEISQEEKIALLIALQPNAVQLAGVTITDEDPAYEIIRRAITSKKKWMPKLLTFEGKAFNRTQMRTDSAIALITEAYSTLYWRQNDSIREVITQQKQTGNLPKGMTPSRVGSIMNFNDNEIKQGGYIFIGPTAPNAFEYYDYKFLSSRKMDDFDVYTIQLIPRSEIVPLFQGTISIAERSYAVMEVDLKPNTAFVQPFINLINPHYKQIFRLIDDKFWLPANYHFESGLEISFVGITFPTINIERDVVIYDYRINPVFADSIQTLKSFSVDSSAEKFDSVFWTQNDVLPLTAEQDSAYQTLDSTQTLEKKLQPKGAAVSFLNFADGGGILGWADVYYNRVEGFHLGAAKTFNDSASNSSYRIFSGYGMSDKEMKYGAGATWRFGERKNSGATTGVANISFAMQEYEWSFDLYKKFEAEPRTLLQSYFLNSFDALARRVDVYNYYRTIGGRTMFSWNSTGLSRLNVALLHEEQSSLKKNTNYALIKTSRSFRLNPGIIDGRMRTLTLGYTYRSTGALSLSREAFSFASSVEYSSSQLGSDFTFTQLKFSAQKKLSTIATTLLFPPSLMLVLSGGMTAGNVPPQRYLTLSSNASIFSQMGMLRALQPHEFYGDRYLSLFLEHNFRRIPFVWWKWLYKTNLEFIVNGAVAQLWKTSHAMQTPVFPFRDTKGIYAEAGFGISNILDLFRVDCTYRFTTPRTVVVNLLISDFVTGLLE